MWEKLVTVEPLYNEGPWDHENHLVISSFSLYHGKKQRNIKSWDQQNDLVKRGFVISDLFITSSTVQGSSVL